MSDIKNKGRQARVYTVKEHANYEDNNCEPHMFNPVLAKALCGNIAAAALFWHLAYNIKSRLASKEVDSFGVPWYKTSGTGILNFMTELGSAHQVKTLINILEEQGLIIKIESPNKNAYTLTEIGYIYAKDRKALKAPTAEAIAASYEARKAKKVKVIKQADPRVKEVIDFLNAISGKADRFGMGKTNTGLVSNLLNRGYSVEDIKKVIVYKHAEWMGTRAAYLVRPTTLFGERFDKWLAHVNEDISWAKMTERRNSILEAEHTDKLVLEDDYIYLSENEDENENLPFL